MPCSTAARLSTGKIPGIPAQIGHTDVFGSASVESTTRQPQNIFERVAISAWTSNPMTGSYISLGFMAKKC